MYCHGHDKEHRDKSWKLIEGNWYCTEFHRPNRMAEFMPERVKDERLEYQNSIVQPFRGDDLSLEYIEAHGTKGIDVTPEQVKKAKHVWKDTPGWHTRKASK